jgi:hypothetical protein
MRPRGIGNGRCLEHGWRLRGRCARVVFAGRPIRRFWDLRGEIIQHMVLYANVCGVLNERLDGTTESVEIPDEEFRRLREAQSVFRDLAARMLAFVLNEPLAMWFVKRFYDPMKASGALVGMENSLHKYGGQRAAAKEELEKVLKFRTAGGVRTQGGLFFVRVGVLTGDHVALHVAPTRRDRSGDVGNSGEFCATGAT